MKEMSWAHSAVSTNTSSRAPDSASPAKCENGIGDVDVRHFGRALARGIRADRARGGPGACASPSTVTTRRTA